MIVVDTSVIAHFWISSPVSPHAILLANADPVWYAPYLWRFEFRNVLMKQMRYAGTTLEAAKTTMRDAQDEMYGRERFADPLAVLDLVASSTCSAYDCEFVALAQELGVPLVTTDKQIPRDFPRVARALADYS